MATPTSRTDRIFVYTPWIEASDAEGVDRVIATGWISSLGYAVRDFEAAVAGYVGRKEAVATMNGTAALHLALAARGIGPGDEVIVPDLTFVATASVVRYTGARPVFADVSPVDWNLTPEEVERRRTKRTKAVIAVHLYGNPADAVGIERAAGRAALIEDAAEAFGAERSERRVGSFGKASAFSFYANKIVTTGEGGMALTDDARMAKRMRFLRDHAMSPKRRYYHPEVGWNYRMTALQAGLGLAQMVRIERILASKDRVAAGYAARLGDLAEIALHPPAPEGARGVHWMYSILLPSRSVRDRLGRHLEAKNIETRPFFLPISSLPPFRKEARGAKRPVSYDLSARGLNLPSGPRLSEADLDRVAEEIRGYLRAKRPGRGSTRGRGTRGR